jgi:hypothetical protein
MFVLDEAIRQAEFPELVGPECLHEEAALNLEHLVLDDREFWKTSRNNLHAQVVHLPSGVMRARTKPLLARDGRLGKSWAFIPRF